MFCANNEFKKFALIKLYTLTCFAARSNINFVTDFNDHSKEVKKELKTQTNVQCNKIKINSDLFRNVLTANSDKETLYNF